MSLVPQSEELAARLVAYRRMHGLSQAQLAVQLGATPQTLGRWEAGQPPQVRWKARLEELLNPLPQPSPLLRVAGPANQDQADDLTSLQRRAIESYLLRAAQAPLSAGELEGFRAVFRHVGLRWPSP